MDRRLAAGIGEKHARGLFEGDDVEIAQGIEKPKGGGMF